METRMLTPEEIDFEIEKVREFFDKIPQDIKSSVAQRLITEIVNWASYNHYEALGIFQEAMSTFREVSLGIMEEEREEERLEKASENRLLYRCIEDVDFLGIQKGEMLEIGFACVDNNYTGGKRYIVFKENGDWTNICKGVLDNHFDLVGEVE